MTKPSPNELRDIAKQVRKDIIEMIYKAGSGHPGGSLSATELIVALYFGVMEADDHFFLSNGHVCPALYSVMAQKGLIDKKLLYTYTELDSPLQGHPERTRLKGIENTSGPLGLGLAQAAGFALASKMDGKDSRIFCMTSDAEHDEGNHWEAVHFAAKYNLSNLVQIVDRNRIQIEGTVEEIMPLGNLKEKYEASNWSVIEAKGHDFDDIFRSFEEANGIKGNPVVIIANTVFGCGISYMEGNPDWHAKAPSENEYKQAMEELK